MIFTKFEQLIRHTAARKSKARCAVVVPEDDLTIQAVVRASHEGLIHPILIGDRQIILEALASHYYDKNNATIIDQPDHLLAAQTAVDLVHECRADCIMKGLIKTDDFLHVMLKRENHLRTGRLVSMLSIRELPHYHKLIAFSDAGVCICPTLDEKRQIIENATQALIAMGFDKPKVGVLASVEEVNPRMKDSVEAFELKKMNEDGIIGNCIVEGPISYDLAINKTAAKIKGYESPVAGDADLLIFPDITCANCTTKAITQTSRVPVGSLILGIKVPLIVPSRASMAETKYMCIALAAATVENE